MNTALKNRDYIDLNKVYPKNEIETKNYKISRVELTKEQVAMEQIRNLRNRWMVLGLKHDFSYVRLIKKGEGVMMSDTPMERNTNREFVRMASGDVLIFGLGLGLIIFPLLEAIEVKSITVVELYQDLIDAVSPYIKKVDKHNKLNIIQGDAFTHQFPKGNKFDTVYFDIWKDICGDNYEEMKKLQKIHKHINYSNPDVYVSHWVKDHVKKLARE